MWGRSATELAAGLRAREFSAREVMAAHLERIADVNPRVNAIVTLLEPEVALGLADAADRSSGPRGVLHGLPIAVKDLEDTAGMRTTYGSPLFAENVPASDSLLGRAAARGGRDRDRQDQHARVRRGLADVQRGLRRDAQPVGPDEDARRVLRRRGGRGRLGDAAVRRRVRPRRLRPQPGGDVQPRRAAPLPRPDPRPRAGRPVEPAARARDDRAHRARRRACCSPPSPGRTRAIRCRSRAGSSRRGTATCAGCGSPGAATSAACRSIPP